MAALAKPDIRNDSFTSIKNGVFTPPQGSSLVAGDSPPTFTNGVLNFNGTQALRFTDSAATRVVPPYSIEVEFSISALPSNGNAAVIMNVGQKSGIDWPEFLIGVLENRDLNVYVNSNNTGGASQQIFQAKSNIQLNTFYKLGVMFYNKGQGNRIRIYMDGVQVRDQPYSLPYNSSNGLSIGSDTSTNFAVRFNGKIKNLYVAQELFWPV